MTHSPPALAEAPDGAVTLPRRAPFWAVCGLALTMAGQLFWLGTYTASIDNRITGAATSAEERYAAVRSRLESLERDRDRLPKLEERFGRIEEKMSMMLELLRETRQERIHRSPG